MAKEYKMNEDSFLVVHKKGKEELFRDENGNIRRKIQMVREIQDDEVNLGSMKNPNKKITYFEYKEKLNLGKMFGGLLGK